MKNKPKYRRPLNTYQIAILNTLYKFRFTTSALLADNQQAKSLRVISSRLKILVDQEYLGMNYDSSYRIKGKAATYYLNTKAVRYLRDQPYTNEAALRSIYHDKRTTDTRIQHRLNVFKTYIRLKTVYPGRYKFFSKSELITKPFVPKQRPDAYLIDSKTDQSYFLDCLEDSMSFWTLRKTIRRYINYAELEIWQKYQSKPHPVVLFVCETEQLVRKVKSMVSKELDKSYTDIQVEVKLDKELTLD
jgi:hypothetical protein